MTPGVEPDPGPASTGPRALRVPWTYLALESALIVMSVLLGFAISEWRRQRTDRELSERVVETIRREIVANREALESALANHEQALAEIRDPEDDVAGIRPAILRNSAWTTAQATGATVHLDYPVTEAAAGVHELQTLHRDAQIMAFEQMGAIRLNPGELSEAELRGLSASTWSGFVGLERRLLEEYERALEVIGG